MEEHYITDYIRFNLFAQKTGMEPATLQGEISIISIIFKCNIKAIFKRGSRGAARAAKSLRWRVY